MEFSKMSGIEKAAILLLCLGEETTAEVFKELSDFEVRMISRSMAQFDHVPAEVAKAALDHYRQTQQEYAGIFIDGGEFMKNAISSSGDPDRVQALLEEVVSGSESRPLETISMMDPRTIAGLLQNEHPQTIALILCTQKSDHTGKVLPFFQEELKADVIHRVAKIDKVSPEVLKQIEGALQKEIGGIISKEQQQVGGVDKVVDILTRMEQGVDQNLLNSIEEADPELAEEIRKKMFTFEDLVGVDDRGMQQILREVDNQTMTTALKTASETVQEKLFSNISQRAREIIKEDLEAMGPMRLSDVEAAQQSIVQIALRLEQEDRIVIPGRGADEVFV